MLLALIYLSASMQIVCKALRLRSSSKTYNTKLSLNPSLETHPITELQLHHSWRIVHPIGALLLEAPGSPMSAHLTSQLKRWKIGVVKKPKHALHLFMTFGYDSCAAH